MILKSYLVENNPETLKKYKFILFYGENIGLKNQLKKKITEKLIDTDIVSLYQEDFSKNKNILLEECKNVSLFSKKKIIIINQANDKLLDNIENLIEDDSDTQVILYTEILEKKSKLRSYFEKNNNLAIVPCYDDNEITLKKIIYDKLKGFNNLNNNLVNMILSYSNLNRNTLLSNLEKITTYFDNKSIDDNSLETILNSDRNEIFEKIRDAALNKEKEKLNSLMNNFNFNSEDAFYYLNALNFRLLRVLEIHKHKQDNDSFDAAAEKVRPAIFWKEKPILINIAKKWHKQRIIEALIYLGKLENSLKNNTNLNSLIVIKNSITNICSNSWTYF